MIVFDRTMAKASIITLRNYGPKLGLIHNGCLSDIVS